MTQLHTLSGSLQVHSPLWRALRRTRKRLRTVADIDTTFREHSLTPRPPNETGTLATHSGKTQSYFSVACMTVNDTQESVPCWQHQEVIKHKHHANKHTHIITLTYIIYI